MMLKRLPRYDDDRGSMPMVILVILIGMTLGALMLTMIVSQTRATRFDTSRIHALDAAQSGIDVVLGQIRASIERDAAKAAKAPDATTGIYYGAAGSLPCGPISSTSANGTGTATYSVTIAYTTGAPAPDGTSWPCPNTGSGSRAPSYAVLTSTGTDGSGVNGASKGRTLKTTYVFQTSNPTLSPGGQLKLYSSGTNPAYCLDAQSATPTAGTPVVLQQCSTATPPAPQQVFAYRSDLAIQLMSSVTATNTAGLCLDTDPIVHNSNVAVVLQPCTTDPSTPSNQQWGVDVAGHLAGWRPDKSNYDGYCISVAAQVNGQPAKLSGCSGSASDPTQTFLPTSSTGSGMAGPVTNQIVNYQRANQCIDDTNADPNYAFLILYPCKQSSNPANVGWNQQFAPALGPPSATAPPLTGTLTMTNGTPYCLRAPAAAPGFPTLSTSCSLNSTNTWTWKQAVDANGKPLPYAQMYTISDSTGKCLGLGPANDLLNGQYPKLVLTACDGDTDQKWNADPRVLTAGGVTTKEN